MFKFVVAVWLVVLVVCDNGKCYHKYCLNHKTGSKFFCKRPSQHCTTDNEDNDVCKGLYGRLDPDSDFPCRSGFFQSCRCEMEVLEDEPIDLNGRILHKAVCKCELGGQAEIMFISLGIVAVFVGILAFLFSRWYISKKEAVKAYYAREQLEAAAQYDSSGQGATSNSALKRVTPGGVPLVPRQSTGALTVGGAAMIAKRFKAPTGGAKPQRRVRIPSTGALPRGQSSGALPLSSEQSSGVLPLPRGQSSGALPLTSGQSSGALSERGPGVKSPTSPTSPPSSLAN